ncbi:three-Cys-motif partner protein TcmP [Kribbella sp. NPDC051952]|uniref:three-Cys-motif partner protein TcmP n=1 Tax=Kribbella sp. NPDC051952 TaxID=3154851 RepID=UPI00343D0563
MPTIWELSPHTKAKHDLLRKYLGGWFPILSRWDKKTIFLDAFAGPGIYANGEPGSPRLALETMLDHRHFKNMTATEFVFLFNEKDPARYGSLKKVVADIEAERGGWPSNVRVIVETMNFVDLADEMLASLSGERMAPIFAFVDPFGYRDVPLDKIRAITQYDKAELFIYFDYNSANRFSTSGKVDQAFRALYGTDEFKNAPSAGRHARGQFLHDLYATQLENECSFRFVRSFEMINARGRTNNYLFYGTRHLKGLALMKEAMWDIAPGGDYSFSDLTAGQPMLMSPDANTSPLMDDLAAQFSGRSVDYQAIEDYVVEFTHFAPSHIKTQTLKPMQEAGRFTVTGQRRRGTFPPQVQITFP